MKRNDKAARLPRMTSLARTLAGLGVIALLLLLLIVYYRRYMRSAQAVESIDALSGQRIGCCAGWETDYLLSDRDDITLLRYDDNTNAMTALAFGQVDAVGIDEANLQVWLQATEGLEILPDPIARIGMTAYYSFGAEGKGLVAEFNDFTAAFQNDPDYADFLDRAFLRDGEEYHNVDVPETEGGETVEVGYIPEYYAECYTDAKTRQACGFGIELMKRFAYEHGYSVRFREVSSDNAYVELMEDRLDFVLCQATDVYRAETEASGICGMSQPYLYCNVYILKIRDGEKLSLKGDLSNLN